MLEALFFGCRLSLALSSAAIVLLCQFNQQHRACSVLVWIQDDAFPVSSSLETFLLVAGSSESPPRCCCHSVGRLLPSSRARAMPSVTLIWTFFCSGCRARFMGCCGSSMKPARALSMSLQECYRKLLDICRSSYVRCHSYGLLVCDHTV